MKADWNHILSKLRAYPPGIRRLVPPCSDERLEIAQAELGRMPGDLTDMLRLFNGAELFCRNGLLVTIFGVSAIPPLPPLEWAPDWYVDIFTVAWRSSPIAGVELRSVPKGYRRSKSV